MPSVELVARRGEVSDFVDATIEEDGRLQVIRNSFGPGDYESEVIASVAADDKARLLRSLVIASYGGRTRAAERLVKLVRSQNLSDRLLLALLRRRFGGRTDALERFTAFSRSKGITVNHFRWP